MRRMIRRTLSLLLAAVMIISQIAILPNYVKAATATRDIEVVLAADAVSNNLDTSGFSDKLKNQLNSVYGIPLDKIHVSTVESSSSSSTAFNWYRFDHTNYNENVSSDTYNTVVKYVDGGYPNPGELYNYALDQHYHINVSGDGKTITFYGYGAPAFKDFLYTPNTNANNKIFTFTVNESNVSYHSADGNGFLFGTNYNTVSRKLSGYVVLVGASQMGLYELNNIDVDSFTQETSQTFFSISSTISKWGGTVTPLSVVTKPSGSVRYLKLVASPTNVSLYQFTDSTYSTTQAAVFTNVSLPDNFGSFGFGPIASYSSHGCGMGTVGVFSNLSVTEDTSVGFADIVRSTNWQYADSLKVFVNLDNDGVTDFGSNDKLSSILYYTMLNNAQYIGWGINNNISIGGYTSVLNQANGFISRNNGKGTFVNRSNSSTSTLDQGVNAIATYIGGQFASVPDVAKPTLTTSISGTNVTCTTPSIAQPTGNAISSYEWKCLDIATGQWTTKTDNSTSASSSFTFAQNSYSMVGLRVQDSGTSQWSDYSYAYIATVATVDPVSQFSLDKTTLMPDTSISALNTGGIVTATDSSYLPNGGQINNWEWTVYDKNLVKQDSYTKTYTNTSIPASVTFDFSSAAAGTYTIKLRTKNSSSDWSTCYSQQVTIYKESTAISIGTTNSTTSANIYTGTTSIPFTISSTEGNITAYRLIKLLPGGTINTSDWTKLNVATVSSSSSVTDISCDVYVQAIDASGNSRTKFVGTYLIPPNVSAIYQGGGSYTSNAPTNKNIVISTTDSSLEYSTDGTTWSTFTSPMTVSAAGTYQFRFSGDTDSSHYTTFTANINKTFSASQTGFTDGGYYNSSVTPSFTGATATLSKDSGTANSFTSGTVVSAEGSYQMTLTDIYGNTSTRSFILDKSAPTDVTISFKSNSFKEFVSTITFGLFYSDNVDVALTANGNISGIDHFEYQLVDEGAGQTYNESGTWTTGSSFTISPQFKGVIYARAIDRAGNVSGVISSNGFVTNNTQPTTPLVLATVGGSAYDGSWVSGDVLITASDAQTLSGIAYYEYKTDSDTAWTQMPASTGAVDSVSGNTVNDKLVITSTIDTTYHIRAVSNSGIPGTERTVAVKHDSEVPQISITPAGTVNTWTKDNVSFTLGNDNGNVLAPVSYWVKVGDDNWTKLPSNTYLFSSEIDKTILFKAVTAAGVENIGATSYDLKIDQSAPTIEGAEKNGSYYVGRVISFTDSFGEINSAVYSLNGAPQTALTSGQLLSTPGSYVITVLDKAGNSSTLTFTVKALPNLSHVVYTGDTEKLIQEIRSEFAEHSDLPDGYEQQIDTLITALEAKYQNLNKGAQELAQDTQSIGTAVGALSPANNGLIAMESQIQTEYDKIAGPNSTLTDEQKAALGNQASYLKSLLDEIAALKTEIAAMTGRTNQISKADDGLIAQKDAVTGLLSDIMKLTKEQQNALSKEIGTLNSLNDKIVELTRQVESAKLAIAALPSAEKVVKSDSQRINAANALYLALNQEQRKLLGSDAIKKLNDAIDALLKLTLYDAPSDVTVTGVDGTAFSPDTYLVVTPIKQEDNQQELSSAVNFVIKAQSDNEDLQGKDLVALYDVSMFKNNVKIQPDGKVQVKIKIPDNMKGRIGLEIIHIADDGTVTTMNATREGDYLIFVTDHFSKYGVIAENTCLFGICKALGIYEADGGICVDWVFILAAVLAIGGFAFWRVRKSKKRSRAAQ